MKARRLKKLDKNIHGHLQKQQVKAMKKRPTQLSLKSTKQTYDDICKTISFGYFNKNQHKYKWLNVKKKIGRNVGNDRFSLREEKNCWVKKKYFDDGEFNPNREINQLNKIGNVFADDKKLEKPKIFGKNSLVETSAQYKKQKMVTFPHGSISTKILLESKKKPHIRATTGQQLNRYRPLNFGDQNFEQCRFVKLNEVNKSNKQIMELEKQVEQLKNNAKSKYGVEFKNIACQQKNQLQFFYNKSQSIWNIEDKLKEIMISRNRKSNIQEKDFSIPLNMLKNINLKKKPNIRKSLSFQKKKENVYFMI